MGWIRWPWKPRPHPDPKPPPLPHPGPQPPPSPPVPPPLTPILNDFANNLLALHNRERSQRGLELLRLNDRLGSDARDHSASQAASIFMTHDNGPDGTMVARLHRCGYNYSTAGENVAEGYANESAVMVGWMNSSDHRRNILYAAFQDVGFGVAMGSDGNRYWTSVFGTAILAGNRGEDTREIIRSGPLREPR